MILAAQSVSEQIADLILYATIVTLGVAMSFALALVGTVQAADARRAGRTGAAVPWGLLALLGYAAIIGFAVKGLIVVTQK